jgi:hypothetical protein
MGAGALGVAAIGATVIGAGVSAYGAYTEGQEAAKAAQMQGVAAAQQAQYQSAIAAINQQTAERNAGLAEINAQYTEVAGAKLQEDRGRALRAIIGAQRAGLAANGLIIDEGSGLDLQNDAAALGGLAIAEIRSNAGRQASGYRIQGLNATDEASIASFRGEAYRVSGQNALQASQAAAKSYIKAGTIKAASSLLGGGTQSFDRGARLYSAGATTPSNTAAIPAIV